MPSTEDAERRLERRKAAITGHQYTEADISETIKKRKEYKAGASKKDLKQGLSKRKIELERQLEMKKGGVHTLTKRLAEKKAKGEEEDRDMLEMLKRLEVRPSHPPTHRRTPASRLLLLLVNPPTHLSTGGTE